MRDGYKTALVALAAVALTAVPVKVAAQDYPPTWLSMDASAGAAMPMGDLSNAVSGGLAAQAGASYFVIPRLALRVEGALDRYDPKNAGGAALDVWHLTGGLQYHLTDPTGGFSAALDLGLGASTMDTDAFLLTETDGTQRTTALSTSAMSFSAGVRLGFALARDDRDVPIVSLTGGLDIRSASYEAGDLDTFARFNGAAPFTSAMSVPVTLGLSVNFN